MRELPVKRNILGLTMPSGIAFEYTTDDRIEDRATLESDSSGIRLPG